MRRIFAVTAIWIALGSAAFAQCNGGISGCPPAAAAHLTDLLATSQANPSAPTGYTTRRLTLQQIQSLFGGGGGSGSPGGVAGEVQFNNGGTAFGGFTVSGDGSLNTSTGSLLVTGTNGVPFAASATVDTTNAANITTGVLPAARIVGTGTLTAGATGAGFTVNIGTSTVLGVLSVPNGGTGAATWTANLPLIGNGTGAVAQGTRSGNTTVFATTSGAFTNGHCLQVDGNGNVVDAGGACTTGGGGGTVSAGIGGQITYYAANGTTVVGNSNANIVNGVLTLGQANSVLGSVVMEGSTSGALTIAPQAVAGTPLWTAGTSSGTPAVTASSPLAIATATGNIACATCATTTNGGAITGTAPIAVSAGGAISISPGTGLSISAGNLNVSNTAVTPSAYGSSTSIPSFTVNQQGQLTAAAGNAVVAPAGTLTGTTLNSGVTASSLTSVGALAGGSLAAGFTPVTGSLIAINTVANGNLAQMTANTIKGNNTGSTANAVDLTVVQTLTLLGVKPFLPNGTAFYVNPSGGATAPCGPSAGRLTCQPGSDANNCTSNATPCQTIGAIFSNKITALLSTGMNPSVYLSDGTYAETIQCLGAPGGAQQLTLVGNSTTPANVIWSAPSGAALQLRDGCIIQINGMRIQSSGAQGVLVQQISILDFLNIDWGAVAAGVHMQVDTGGFINDNGGTYAVTGSAIYHIENNGGKFYSANARSVALPNSITFTYFVFNVGHAETIINGLWTFTGAGSCTAGTKWLANQFSILNLSSTVLPCPTAGSTTAPAIVVP